MIQMKITYDASADAAYIYLSDKIETPDTRQLDEDILIDFNAQNQMIGIEVLDASKRLQLSELAPLIEQIDASWQKLTAKLHQLKYSGEALRVKASGNWSIEEIRLNEVSIKSEDSGRKKTVGARTLLRSAPNDEVIETLRKLGDYDD